MMKHVRPEEPDNEEEGKKPPRVQSKGLEQAVGKDLGTRLEIVRRRLEKLEDDDPELESLIRERRKLERERRIRRLTKELAQAKAGEDDDECLW